MKTFIVSDWHLNHANIITYCDRPKNFTDMIIKRHNERVAHDDVVINLGDVAIGPPGLIESQIRNMNGRHILIKGNHDHKSSSWYMEHGFQFCCDAMIYRGAWLTHRPAPSLPEGTHTNVHGHLHNIWDGFHPNGSVKQMDEEGMRLRRELKNPLRRELKNPWQRLFAIEYTDYYPIEFEEFMSHPDKYKARGARQ
jgi:calcineurin-like phosphoesterase family protein